MRRFVATASLVALCAGVVEAAPQFLGFTCGPAIVDARKNDVEVTCAARVLDKSSEIVSAIAQVTSPSGKHVIPLYFDAQKSFGLGAVTGINIGAKFVVPKNAEPGLWQVSSSSSTARPHVVMLVPCTNPHAVWRVGGQGWDRVGRRALADGPPVGLLLLRGGLQITFDGPYQLAVTNKKGETTKVSRDQAGGSSGIQPWVKVYSNDDQSPPFIKDITCDSPLMQNNTFLQGIPVVCEFEATDTGSGVNFVRANFISPSGKTIITLSANTATNLVSGSGDDVKLKATEPGYPGMEPGRWKMLMSAPFAPYVEDHNKNGFTYEGLDPEKFFTRAWFDVYSNPDTEPPVVQKFTCSATQAVVPFNGTEEYGCQLVVQVREAGSGGRREDLTAPRLLLAEHPALLLLAG